MNFSAMHTLTFISQDFSFNSLAEARYRNPNYIDWSEK